ncbi:MAG: DUF4194 domain-containing protein [Lachnospiraceae bacterium]|nr:DUF4194 domain-containing protein [Candidatus Fimimorpha excrementavium]
MDILDQIASRGMLQKEKDELKRICNRLLSSSFLCQKNDASRSDYYFVLKFRTEFQTLLETLGFRLEINEVDGVIQLTNPQNYNRMNLKLYESILLLILRILYDEKKRELSVSDEAIINLGDIQDKFLSLKIRDKMIDKTTMRNALALFRRMNLIETLDRDLTKEETRILIFNSILMAVRIEDINQAYEKLELYRKGNRSDEETDENETD